MDQPDGHSRHFKNWLLYYVVYLVGFFQKLLRSIIIMWYNIGRL